MPSLYQPPQFKAKDEAHAYALMKAYPFATLICNDDQGFPYVTHLPLHVLQTDGTTELLGHVAKANQLWRFLRQRPEALVAFMGPYAYLSPQVYPDLARVPSWNYLSVHARVKVSLVEEPKAKDALLKRLIGDHEPAYRQQWIDLGEEYQHKMLAGIVGLRLEILSLDCTLKLNQHRPESHQALSRMYQVGNDHQRSLADWMKKLGLV
jgi:transcriptional regulator